MRQGLFVPSDLEFFVRRGQLVVNVLQYLFAPGDLSWLVLAVDVGPNVALYVDPQERIDKSYV